EKVPVFYEDEDGHLIDPRKGARPSPRQVAATISVRPAQQILGRKEMSAPKGGFQDYSFGYRLFVPERGLVPRSTGFRDLDGSITGEEFATTARIRGRPVFPGWETRGIHEGRPVNAISTDAPRRGDARRTSERGGPVDLSQGGLSEIGILVLPGDQGP